MSEAMPANVAILANKDVLEILSQFAQMALVLAGFSGVAEAVHTGPQHPWDRWRSGVLLLNSLLTFVTCLVPIVLLSFARKNQDDIVWTVASIVLITREIALFVLARLCRIMPDKDVRRTVPAAVTGTRLVRLCASVTVVTQICNIACCQRASLFILGISMPLVVSVIQFTHRFVVRPDPYQTRQAEDLHPQY